jgi:polysaccharide export outer membrane protein
MIPLVRIREFLMRCFAIPLLAIAISSSIPVFSQQTAGNQNAGTTPAADSAPPFEERLGVGDVIGVSVYESPDLTRNVRIDPNGDIRLPFVRQHIHAAGLTSDELESAIAAALVEEQLMIAPIVSVSVAESHSRPITVLGAVKAPTSLDAPGTMTLLEAILKAGGLSDTAGTEIEVSHPSTSADGRTVNLTERIPVRPLMDGSDPAVNIKLSGGETVRVLENARIFIVGNVIHPGPVPAGGVSDNTVLKAITLAGGLDSFTSRTAYIYRTEAGNGEKNRIPIPIKKIMTFKAPDVPLYGGDMLYVPSATGQRFSSKALAATLGVGLGVAALVIYIVR